MYITKETIQIEPLSYLADLYIALPEGYAQGEQRYPVLYMSDGQNLFFAEDSYMGETWRVAEVFKENPDIPEVIVIGVSSPPTALERLDAYGPDVFDIELLEAPRKPGGKADHYLDWLVGTLKPMIDGRYRTLKAPENTLIAGSSMGGILSLHALLRHPDVFGRAASVSGAYFVALEPVLERLKKSRYDHVKKLYIDVGDHESAPDFVEAYLMSNQSVYEQLRKHLSPDRLQYQIIAGGEHHEMAWAMRFPDILRFLLG